MATPQGRILIIGAGLGGLTLAHGLKSCGIPFHIYERDSSPYERRQGYRVRINGDGAAALSETLPPHLYALFEQSCAETLPGVTRVDGPSGEVTGGKSGAEIAREHAAHMKNAPVGKSTLLDSSGVPVHANPHSADRTLLRGVLLLGLEDDISWGKGLVDYTVNEDGGEEGAQVEVHFRDGSKETGRMLVGADGVRSAVRRKHVPDYRFVDTEGRCIYGKTPLTAELEARFPAAALRHMTLIEDGPSSSTSTDKLFLLLEPQRFRSRAAVTAAGLPDVQDYVYWVLGGKSGAFGAGREMRVDAGQAAADLALSAATAHGWHPALRSLLELQDSTQPDGVRVLSARPDVPLWPASRFVTLIGDAAHAMAPTGGVGANSAIRDAANLARFIKESGNGVEVGVEVVRRYEDEMRRTAKLAIEWSYTGAKRMFDQRPWEELQEIEL